MKASGLFVWWAGKMVGLIGKSVISGKAVVVIVFIEGLQAGLEFRILNLKKFWLDWESGQTG